MKQVILIVDDEEAVWQIWTRHLNVLKFELRRAKSVSEAIEQNSRLPMPDIIFLDLNLLDTHGEQTVYTIPQLKAINPNARIIIATGWGTDEIQRLAMTLGGDMFLDKRDLITQTQLFDAMKRAVEVGGTARQRTESQLKLVERLSAMIVTKTQRLQP